MRPNEDSTFAKILKDAFGVQSQSKSGDDADSKLDTIREEIKAIAKKYNVSIVALAHFDYQDENDDTNSALCPIVTCHPYLSVGLVRKLHKIVEERVL